MSCRATFLVIYLAFSFLAFLACIFALVREHHGVSSSLFKSATRPSIIHTIARTSRASSNEEHKSKVPLEIHIMSKCPDAKDCLEMLIAPAMGNISDIVDFRMSFIGRPTEAGISCLHGPSECLSNAFHLCAAHLYPTSTSLPFSLCLTHNYTLLPQKAFIESCAAAHDVSFTKLNDCVSDIGPEGGMHLLAKSVQRSRRANAEVSCTVRVDNQKWCVRDGGEWKECEEGSEPRDLVAHVEELYQERNGKRRVGLVQQGGEMSDES